MSTTSQRAAAVRMVRVPVPVVVRISVLAFGGPGELARRGADVEPLDHDGVSLTAHDRFVAELVPQRPRLLDLRAAEHALLCRCERLRDR